MEQLLAQFEIYLQTSLTLSLATAFVGGLLASLTPCVYPMIPITIAFIGNANIGGSKLRGVALSLAYVLGMAVIYSAIGVFTVLTGRFFGFIATSPITFLVVGNVVLLLGLAMLDVFHLPSYAPNFIAKIKGPPGAFLFGMASGLVSGPCTTPVLGILLTYVASTNNIVFGAVLLFCFSLGLSTILLLVGTFSGLMATLPRPGHWMVTIKKILALLMIALAEYYFVKAGYMFV